MLKRHFAQSTESENLSQDINEKCFECKNRDADQVKIQMYKSSAMVLIHRSLIHSKNEGSEISSSNPNVLQQSKTSSSFWMHDLNIYISKFL